MSLLPLPLPVLEELHSQDQDYPYDMEQNSSFTINEAVSDISHFKFGRNDLDRPSEVMLRGQVYWRPSMAWCQPMSKISVGIPTLYKPVQLQLKIVTTIDYCNTTDENETETWVGFYLSVEDICTLKNWENWTYLNLNIRTPFQEKRAKYVQYSPANNCWGWSKFFRVSTMMACKGNPFIIDIGVEHNPIPLFLRLPCLSLRTPEDHLSNFNDEWKNISKLQTSNIQDLLVMVDNDKGDMSGVSLNDEIVMKEDSEEPVAPVAVVVQVPVPVVPSESDNISVISRTKLVSSINNVSASSSKGTIIQPQSQPQTQQHVQKNTFGGGKNGSYKRRSRNSVGGVRRGYSTHNNSNSDRNRENNISISQHSTTMIFSNRSRPHASSAHGNFTQGQSQNQNQGTSSGVGESSNSNGHQYHNYNSTHSHSHRRKVRSAV